MASINICHPFPVIFPIIQIKHGSHSIHPDTVRMILLNPVKCIGYKIIGYLRPSIIINQCSPMGMAPLPGILMFIKACPIEIGQSISISGKMCRNPVQNHSNPGFVHFIHKIHKVLIGAVSRRGRIISNHLVSPGTVKRMLHHRHQLNMGIPHFFHILNHQRRQFPVIQITAVLSPFKGTQIQFIDANRLIAALLFFPLIHPFLVFPFYFASGSSCPFPYHRSSFRTKLLAKSIWVGLQIRQPTFYLDFIFIILPGLCPRHKDFKNPGAAQLPHLVNAPIPVIKIPYGTDP